MSAELGHIYFDLTDLLHYMIHNRHVTGIQRVASELGVPSMREGARGAIFDADRCAWLEVDAGTFLAEFDRYRSASAEAEHSRSAALTDLRSTARAIDFTACRPFPVLIALGAHWDADQVFASIRVARRQAGLVFACLIHDTIPIRMPEYCHSREQVEEYRRWFAAVITNADVVLTVSRHNQFEIDRACTDLGLPHRRLTFCPLNGAIDAAPTVPVPVRPEIVGTGASGFVLCVGTIEPRKDHLFLLTCWRRLLETYGAHDLPTLVLVGTLGWQYESVLLALEEATLRGRVRLLRHVSESELSYLYEKCLFVIYNSIHEGWGLPVSESLARGKIPLIPDHSSLVEAGGDCAVFFQASSQADFLAKVIRLLRDAPYRDAILERIRTERNVRSWRALGRELVDNVLESARQCDRPVPELRPGTIYRIARDPQRLDMLDYAIAESLRLHGWHKIEDWGSWTSAEGFGIVIRIADGEPGSPAIDDDVGSDHFLVYVVLSKIFGNANLTCHLDACATRRTVHLDQGRTVLRIDVPGQLRRQFAIDFHQDGMVHLPDAAPGGDHRTIGVGVEAVMVCRRSDTAARQDLLEHFLGCKRLPAFV